MVDFFNRFYFFYSCITVSRIAVWNIYFYPYSGDAPDVVSDIRGFIF